MRPGIYAVTPDTDCIALDAAPLPTREPRVPLINGPLACMDVLGRRTPQPIIKFDRPALWCWPGLRARGWSEATLPSPCLPCYGLVRGANETITLVQTETLRAVVVYCICVLQLSRRVVVGRWLFQVVIDGTRRQHYSHYHRLFPLRLHYILSTPKLFVPVCSRL